jgi:hypothetical protein
MEGTDFLATLTKMGVDPAGTRVGVIGCWTDGKVSFCESLSLLRTWQSNNACSLTMLARQCSTSFALAWGLRLVSLLRGSLPKLTEPVGPIKAYGDVERAHSGL